ncbi:UvrD-helicase domain-containing protein [Geomonas nitrogeniifigens]|uniref:UvrD-helicase domain-containing protein n=1 Tax=Geomonas diazotrophica TaxID=2843197 RepID=UPI001C2C7BC6|nr:UvrD-helicase domain-containing protein [Geomonas nitrogeniifigens]QXE85552.1 UvrD-helicase domain-containing protein [Geomonas nitrogeniifigens]
MTIPPLTIIPAGAGSGKTYTLQKTLAEWVNKGWVEPDRIVAVTFTEAAAGELKDRIREELVSRGRLDDALKLERSYISTIHGFGLRVLSEFAFDAGLSPAPRLLNEDEEAVLIRTALAAADRAEDVLANLAAYGYRYNFNTGTGAEDQFKERVLQLIAKLRSIGRLEEDPRITPHALKMVERVYGQTVQAKPLKEALQRAVTSLLQAFPKSLAPLFAGNKTAEKEFREDFLALARASNPENLDQDWQTWQRLRQLRLSKRGAQTPGGYDALAEVVMAAAEALPTHPGPREQAMKHVEGLLEVSQECLNQYAEGKKAKGLVDYSDMLAISQRLLAQRPDVLQELKTRVDCLVIDEFQDTNPLQFALVWALFSSGVPAVIVGDLKQAIMGFQNADPRLLENLAARNETRPLTGNWRSTPKVMKWVNQVGKALFGDAYTELTPMANYPSHQTALEVMDFEEGPYRGSTRIPAQYTALRIRDLLADDEQKIYDKRLKKERRIRGGDVAVLCPAKERLERYAEALRQLGIKTRMDEDGWFDSRPVQIAFHALSYLADHTDRHAALYLAVTELGRHDLQSAVAELLDGRKLDDPVLARLDALVPSSVEATVTELVAAALEALDLYDGCSCWPDAASARANLLRLQGEAAEFQGANVDALVSGRYYGTGLKTFLAWLRGKVERDNKQPAPRVLDEDAVVLTTWHSSKGREWPVVAVCATDTEVYSRFPEMSVVYEDFDDLAAVLDKASMEISPAFVAPETQERFAEPLMPELRESALRLIYVAITRAREKVILECRRYQEPEKSSYWTILQQAGRVEIDGNKMIVLGEKFDCRVVQCGKHAPEGFEDETSQGTTELPFFGRRAIRQGAQYCKLTPEVVTPSSQHGAEAGMINTITYGEPLRVDLGIKGFDRGTFLHRCFEASVDTPDRLQLVADSLGIKLSDAGRAAIGIGIEAFRTWLKDFLVAERAHVEVPILAQNAEGSVVAGSIDLLVETPAGLWIVDHKSDQSEEFDSLFAFYRPQLEVYREAVYSLWPDKKVLGIVINWVSHGKVSMSG